MRITYRPARAIAVVSSFAIAMPMGVALVASPASADPVIEVEYVPPVTLLPEVDEGGDGGSGGDGGDGGENPTWILEPPTTFPVPEDEILTDEEKAAGEKAYAEGAGVLVVQPDPDVVRAAFNSADHVRIDSFECEAGTVRAGGPASTCTLTVSSLAREFTDEVRDWFVANAGNFSVEPGTGFTIVEQGTCEVTGPQSCTISGIQPDWVAANANSDLAMNLAYELVDRSAAGLSAYSDAGTLYPACPVLDDAGVQVTWEFEPETAIVNTETEVSVTAIPALNNGYATAWDGDVTWAHEATNLARSPLTTRDIAFTSDWDAELLDDAVRAEAAREVKLKKSGTYLWTAVAEFSPEQRDGVPTCAGARASSTYTVDALGASSDALIFTSNAGPDGRLGLKWGYEAKDPRGSAVQQGDSWIYTVPGGMVINVTDGASQWTDVLQWGASTVGDAKSGRALGDANGAGSLRKISAEDTPALASNLEALFQGQPAFNGVGVKDWETGGVTRMGRMFTDAYKFNGDISGWDVSSVTDFASMFVRARAFNQDISGWVTTSVKPEVSDRCFEPEEGDNQCNTTGMGAMFYGANEFDWDLSGWDVSTYSTTDGAVRPVDGTRQIAFGSTSEIGKGKVATPFTDNADWDRCKQPQFDPDLECGVSDDALIFTSNAGPNGGRLGLKWGYEAKDPRGSAVQQGDSWIYTVPGGMVINVTDGASQWTDVLQWGASTVGDAKSGRALGDANGAGSLRKISAEDTPALASNLEALFQGQPAFNGVGVKDWETGGVTRMGRMFTDAYKFNGDISGWDVSSVTDFASMFVRARAFNQDISGWVTTSVKPEVSDRCFEPEEGDNQCNTTGMGAMFYGANEFDWDLSGWDVSTYSTTDGAVRPVDGTRQIAFGSTSEIGKGKVATPFTDNADWDRCKQPQFDPETPCNDTGDDGAPIVITDEGVVEGLPNGEGDSFEITNSSGEDLWIVDSNVSVNGVSCATGCKIPAGETVSFTVDDDGFDGTLTPTSQDPTAEPEDVNQGVLPGAQQQGQGSVTPEPGVPDAAGDIVNPKAVNSVVVTLDGQTAQATGGRVGVLPYGEYQVAATARSGGVVDLTVGGDGCSLQGDVLSVTQTNANCTLSTSVAETDTFEGASDVYEAATAMGTQTAALSAPASKKIKVGKTLTLAKPGEAETNAGKKVTFTVVKGKKRCEVRTTKKGAVKLDMNKKGDCVVEASAKKVPQKYKAGKGVATYTGVKSS
ncbi:MAG: BspA family leucine-rich repeat surface protein [Candidatus Nanopelagicales bacterium]|nr:BspA family leucine-rich repeat surface protein [Candidatus Nanopelagicales bacterium]